MFCALILVSHDLFYTSRVCLFQPVSIPLISLSRPSLVYLRLCFSINLCHFLCVFSTSVPNPVYTPLHFALGVLLFVGCFVIVCLFFQKTFFNKTCFCYFQVPAWSFALFLTQLVTSGKVPVSAQLIDKHYISHPLHVLYIYTGHLSKLVTMKQTFWQDKLQHGVDFNWTKSQQAIHQEPFIRQVLSAVTLFTTASSAESGEQLNGRSKQSAA